MSSPTPVWGFQGYAYQIIEELPAARALTGLEEMQQDVPASAKNGQCRTELNLASKATLQMGPSSCADGFNWPALSLRRLSAIG